MGAFYVVACFRKRYDQSDRNDIFDYGCGWLSLDCPPLALFGSVEIFFRDC